MGRDQFLQKEWVEIVLVLEDCTLIDSAYDLHVFDSRQALAPGFYLAVHVGDQREFARSEMIGPFQLRGMVEMLYDSARHLGAGGCPEDLALMRPMPSVLPAIRRPAAHVRPAAYA